VVIPRLKPDVNYDRLAALVAGPRPGAAARASYEEALRAHFGAARVYALSSGRGALLVALRALGVGFRDEVALPALTCAAVADAVLALGGVPHLVDVSPRHFGMAIHSLRRVLAGGRTRAVVVAPLFGICPPQLEMEATLAASGVPWVEDIAQGFGGRRAGRPVGAAAPLAVLSTNFDKPFTTGRGGALVVNDASYVDAVDALVAGLPEQGDAEAVMVLKGLVIADRLFDAATYEPFLSYDVGYRYAAAEGDAYDWDGLLGAEGDVAAGHARRAADRLMAEPARGWGRRLARWFFPRSAVPPLEPGSRLSPLLAAVGEAHLGAVAAAGERRRRLAARLDEAWADHALLRGPAWAEPGDEPWPIRYPAFVRDADRRPALIVRLRDAGVEAGPFVYPRPLSGQFPYYKLARHAGRYLRGAWRAAAALLNLPLHAAVTDADVARMAEVING